MGRGALSEKPDTRVSLRADGLLLHGRGRGVPRRAARLARRRTSRSSSTTGTPTTTPGGGQVSRLRPDPGAAQGLAAPARTRAAGPRSTGRSDWNGREATPVQNAIYAEEMARVRAPGIYNTNGIWQIGPMIIQWGTEEQQQRWLPGILTRRRALVPGLQRARGRLGPRQHAHDGDPRRRRLRRQRAEDLDLVRAPRALGPLPAPHRPDRVRAGREARGHHRVHHRHGDARHRVPADPRHHRRHHAQRGVVHRRRASRSTAGSAARARAGRSR